MKTRILLSVLLIGLFYGCSSEPIVETTEADALLVTESSKAATPERPFKVRGYGTYALEPSTECAPLGQIRIEGGGIGTHVGKFSAALIQCSDGASINIFSGVVTAANGDKVNIFSDVAGVDEIGPYDYYIIDGGTGRFTDASGSFRLYNTSLEPDGTGGGSYSNYGVGTISY